jgi:2-polyprenyl-3-methyl-5-hydroxy-6-metoxy-1,4-benzoquinol methylase
MAATVHHADAEITIETNGTGKNKVTVKLHDDTIYMPIGTIETAYPVALIEKILRVKGPAYLCDEISRDESSAYVQKNLEYDVFAYVDRADFNNRKILDFGCGSGASTMLLGRMLPTAHITGIELEPALLEIAEARCNHYQFGDRITFRLSPDGKRLPKGIGAFDYIFMNAVYEHLLPEERADLLPLLWARLKPGGVLFVNQTPYRWFPIETHTTGGLVFINYMPDGMAFRCARRFSGRNLGDIDWETMLRKGIRGGSAGEILKRLANDSYPPILLEPGKSGLKDRIDIWYGITPKTRWTAIKRMLFRLFKAIKLATGKTFLPILSLAIQKPGEDDNFHPTPYVGDGDSL